MPEPAVPRAALACPLCGGPNACAPAASGRFDVACWCSEVRIDDASLARVAPQVRHRACLCPRCAAGSGVEAPAADSRR